MSRSPADARNLISLLNWGKMKGFTSESPLFGPPGLIWTELEAIKRLRSTNSSRTDTERNDITNSEFQNIPTNEVKTHSDNRKLQDDAGHSVSCH